VGVFASRSTFRPNPIGMSAVELIQINHTKNKLSLLLRGCDLVDGTPIVDIKPYIPYADNIPEANAGFATTAPNRQYEINFTDLAAQQCQIINIELNQMYNSLSVDLKKLITQILQLDPRPSYQQIKNRVYGMRLYHFDLKWTYKNDTEILVLELPISTRK
jgi:hypothetical protein